jgi:hypothetical protein
MERYIFVDPSRVPPGLHVIGVPTPQGFVWLEITEAEYRAATEDLEAAHRLTTYAAEVIAARLAQAREPVRESRE